MAHDLRTHWWYSLGLDHKGREIYNIYILKYWYREHNTLCSQWFSYHFIERVWFSIKMIKQWVKCMIKNSIPHSCKKNKILLYNINIKKYNITNNFFNLLRNNNIFLFIFNIISMITIKGKNEHNEAFTNKCLSHYGFISYQ